MSWMQNKRIWAVAAIVVAVPVVAVAGWLGLPLFVDTIVEEDFPMAETAEVPVGMTRTEVEDTMAVIAKMDAPMAKPEPMTKEMAEPETVALKSGEFRDADSFHKGEGTATIYTLTDGTRVLRLESFKVTNGPDLRVILTPNADPKGRSDVTAQGYVELGKLKGNIGNQNYPIPDDVDPDSVNAVVIYCKPFHVLFSVASLN